MWTGNTKLTGIEAADKLSRKLTFTFEDPNSGQTDTVTDLFSDFSDESLRRYVSNLEKVLDSRDGLEAKLNTIIKTIPDAPSQADKDLQTFQQNVQIKKKMETAIIAGDKKNTDADYTAVVAAVKQGLTAHSEWIAYYS